MYSHRLLVLSLFLAASTVSAATITIDATASGFYQSTGSAMAGNYATGWYAVGSSEMRGFFLFDLAGVTGSIVSAQLHVSSGNGSTTGYFSPDPSETLELYDVSTMAATLQLGKGGASVFDDLGTGLMLGSATLSHLIPTFINIELNGAGLSYLNSNLGPVAFGAAITTLTRGSENEAIFNSTNASLTRQLILVVEDGPNPLIPDPAAVPEPATLWLGLFLLPLLKKNQKQ
ncbi:hypothetical protein [Bryobacter aggregatus]|uniref:hypothetical protein n=1 Tax=Bryobacter aggregatus TaxID=360054 RepID=UPI0004E15BFB|nr:hypothetical protein [Bryobacter aggregatus]